MSAVEIYPFKFRSWFFTSLLSTDLEFLHDMTVHIAALVRLLVRQASRGKSYKKYSPRLQKKAPSTKKPPGDPTKYEPGSFVMWRSQDLYHEGDN